MDPALVRFLAQSFGAAFTSSPRPALTFFVIQLAAAVGIWLGELQVTPGLAWLVSGPAVIVAGILALVEIAMRHDPEIEAFLRELKIDHAIGAFGAFSSCLLFASLGLPEAEALGLVETTGKEGEVSQAMLMASSSSQPEPVRYAVIGAAVGLNGVLTWVRGEVIEFLSHFELDRQWHRIETGGALGVLTLVIWLPALALGAVIAMAIGLGLLAWAIRLAEDWLDQQERMACRHCGTMVRKEASICFQCRSPRVPEQLLGQEHPHGWKELVSALRRRPAAQASMAPMGRRI